MHALDRFIPNPRLVESDGTDLAVSPSRAWELVRHVDLARAKPIRALFALRTAGAVGSLRIDDMVSSPERPGFGILAEEPGHVVVVGAVGKVWKRDIPFVHVEPADFEAFGEPDWVKVAWSIEVAPRDGGSRVTIELRVDATDDRAWKKFRRYFRVVGIGSRFIRHSLLASLAREHGTHETPAHHDVAEGVGGALRMMTAMLTPFLRSGRSHWGVTEAVAERRYPGDDIVASPRWSWTHGVEVDAPAELVWPWVAQIGADRAGFYSYEWLENLAGCRLHNADTVHPEWVHRGRDGLSLHPNMPPMRVDLAPGQWLLASTPRPRAGEENRKPWMNVSWLFFLEPLGVARCRLVSRFRCATSQDVAMRVSMGPTFVEPIGYVMDKKMLRGIKSRAEQLARSAARAQDRPGHPRDDRA
jgi:hypothetical protein